jgi:hypothetical protein
MYHLIEEDRGSGRRNPVTGKEKRGILRVMSPLFGGPTPIPSFKKKIDTEQV